MPYEYILKLISFYFIIGYLSFYLVIDLKCLLTLAIKHLQNSLYEHKYYSKWISTS
jgi:hypothetical protein